MASTGLSCGRFARLSLAEREDSPHDERMIHHLVFFKMKGGASADELVSRLAALEGKIDELKKIEVGADFSKTPASYDVGLYTVFETTEALEAYRVHPLHQEVVAWVKENTSDRAVVDFEA